MSLPLIGDVIELKFVRIFHPIIFAGIPALSLYVNNVGLVRFVDFMQTLVVMLLVGIMLWWLVNVLARDLHKAAILTTILLILFYSYGHIFTSLNYILGRSGVSISFAQMQELSQGWLLIFYGVLLSLVIILIIKSVFDFSKISQFFNVFGLLLILVTVANFFITSGFLARNPTSTFGNLWRQDALSVLEELQITNTQIDDDINVLPDIYYIILDGYGRHDVLLDIYDFDNSEFIEFLEESGFFVAKASTANYNFTLLSLSSALNFTYLDPVVEIVGSETGYTFPLELILEDNRLFRHLRQVGYRIVTFSTGYDATDLKTADVFLSPHSFQFNAFQGQLVANTPLPAIFNWLSLKNQYDLHRENILYVLETLPQATEIAGPKFVFAHILAPHPPFVFNRNGEPIQPDRPFSISDGDMLILGEGQEEYYKFYRDQIQFITGEIQKVIDELLAKSSIPPIIILQSDHGPGSMLSYSGPDQSNLYERMSILNAYYFPDGDYRNLYDSITPVNTFRLLLDKYFETNYGLVADRNYFVRGDQLYYFVDVTDQVKP